MRIIPVESHHGSVTHSSWASAFAKDAASFTRRRCGADLLPSPPGPSYAGQKTFALRDRIFTNPVLPGALGSAAFRLPIKTPILKRRDPTASHRQSRCRSLLRSTSRFPRSALRKLWRSRTRVTDDASRTARGTRVSGPRMRTEANTASPQVPALEAATTRWRKTPTARRW